MELKIKKISPKIGDSIPEPYYATPGSAAMDLHACMDEPVTLPSLGRAMIPSGIAVALPSPDYVALVFARSGLSTRHGIALTNSVGVVDSDYRGEIKIGLVNLSTESYTVMPGDRIAQLAVMPVCRAETVFVDDLPETQRGEGGFGSTGK